MTSQINPSRYQIREEDRAEVAAQFGEAFALSVFARFDLKDIFAPVCTDANGRIALDASQARHIWPDMLEEVR